MPVASLLQDKREQILSLAARHGARNVRIFGSAARGDTGPDSLDLGGLLMDLRELFGRDVDVVTEPSLHWYIRDRILREAVPL
ncbi:MAG: hypothetical protein NTX40_09410 [Planctomycetota bacterium]|nr:hypothetical protein [Planctomycetota bacterium]